MVVRGVPDRIAKDAWWLDDCDPPKGFKSWPLFLAVLVAADFLLWGVTGGIGFALWMTVLAGAICLTVCRDMTLRNMAVPLTILGLAFLPLIEVVQFSTVIIAIIGLMAFGLLVTGTGREQSTVLSALWRLPFVGVLRSFQDLFALRMAAPTKSGVRSVVFDWAFPAVIGGLFIILLVSANPVLDQWLGGFLDFDTGWLPGIDRVLFWAFFALASWPLVRLSTLGPDLRRPKTVAMTVRRPGLVNARSALRALIVFNVIFAVQTALDLGYLWGGFALPDGMTYANYAHRGAYPLLVSALLAGLFAVMTQPFLGGGRGLRWLLYLWIGQTALLVLSSILRLDLYVEVYGLTRMRLAAFVWMAVVMTGLALLMWQMVGRFSIRWLMSRASLVGFAAFYLFSLINIDGVIARYNLSNAFDDYYLCSLSEGAAPAIRAYQLKTGTALCNSDRPYVYQSEDWREWGYRNARVRRSLIEMEVEL